MATGALDGVLVADFSRVLAGPLATMNLADLGADVVKVERPDGGDDTRGWGPPWTEDGTSPYYLGLNRGKRSVALDLTDPGDLELARRLAARADVVVESFRAGTMERFGLGYDDVAAASPGVVYCSVTAFGRASQRPGYDFLLQAMGGLMSVTGEQDGEPLKVGAPLVDLVTGLYATIAILGGLQARAADPEGRGQHVEATLMLAALSSLVNQGSNYLLAGVVARPLGNRHPTIAPYSTYHASDGPFALGVGNDAMFARLCATIGRPELAGDERFATNAARRAHIEELDAELERELATRTADDWIAVFTEAGVPAGPINDVAGAYAMARELGLEPDVAIDGLRLPAPPFRLGRTPSAVRSPPPRLDQHGDEIRSWLAAG
jgi:crotonobetainyl-CoA:carnitine CoA-transferase CaiB-like acyl-CoA transferase